MTTLKVWFGPKMPSFDTKKGVSTIEFDKTEQGTQFFSVSHSNCFISTACRSSDTGQ